MNKVEVAFENSTTFYAEARYSNGVVGLLYTLDDGVRLDERRLERLRAGKPLPEDYARKDL